MTTIPTFSTWWKDGWLAFLNEECVRPGGSDAGFVSKVHSMNKDNPCLIRENSYHNYEFCVRHYAGKVLYDATAFVTKNMDSLAKDLHECASRSTNAILSNELDKDHMMNTPAKTGKRPPAGKELVGRKRGGSAAQQTVWTKFKNQLTSLMTSLKTTRTRYIRCIKPNSMKKPLIMQHRSTIEQLRCAGVVAAVTISRSAFPNRLEHRVVLDRFRSLWRKGDYYQFEQAAAGAPADEAPRILAAGMLTTALKGLETEKDGTTVQAFVMGRTRAYFRAGALEYLENNRLKHLHVWAVEIQWYVHEFVARSRYVKLRASTIQYQAFVRMSIARKSYFQQRKASIAVQCWYRCVLAHRMLEELNRDHKATLIQTHWRMAVALTALKRNVRAALGSNAISCMSQCFKIIFFILLYIVEARYFVLSIF